RADRGIGADRRAAPRGRGEVRVHLVAHRRHHRAARILVGGSARTGPRLRRSRPPVDAALAAGGGRGHRGPAPMSLFDKRLLVIAGKGGVGRTTVGAAFAAAAARRGKRVLLAQTKSKERLSHLFGVPSVGAELTRVRDKLWAVNMTPIVALREYGTMVLRSEFIAKQVLENKVSRAFLHAVPGIDDYSMLGKVWYHTT